MKFGKWKRIAAGILAAVMIATSVPSDIFAAEENSMENAAGETHGGKKAEMLEETEMDLIFGEETADEESKTGEAALPSDNAPSSGDRTETDVREETEYSTSSERASENDLMTETETGTETETQTDTEMTEEESDTEETDTVLEIEEESQTDTEEIPEKEFDVRAASDITRDEALAWVNSKAGQQLDYAGRYGAQCTDLIYYYYQYLGAAVLVGNASAYATNALPAGWNRIRFNANVKDVQPGDIAVWTGPYASGHVAIVVSADANGFHVAEQNYAVGADGTYDYGDVPCAIRYHEGYRNGSSLLNCVIRPNFKAEREHGSYWEEGYYQVIPDGDYHIVSSLGDQWWLTNAGFDMNDGGNVQLWEYGDMDCEDHLYHFEFIPDGKGIGRGFYKITNKLSGKCLDSAGANEWLYDQSTGRRTNVQQWTDSSNDNSNGQRWAVNEIDGGDKGMLYTFQARCSGYYIDLEDAKTESGTNISMWKGDGTVPAQQWRLIPWAPSVGRTIDDGTYQIAPIAAEHKVLSASGTNPESGANIELNSYKGDYRHTFDVKYLGDGYYSIINSYSGASLDVADASRKLGTNIKLWEYGEGKNAQKWIIKSCGDGYYNVVSKCNGLYLDLEGGNVQDGTNISLWKWYEGSTNQKWKFIPCKKTKLQSPTSTLSNITAVEAGTKFWLDGNGADEIYFTWDGTEPTRNSMKYSNFKNTGLQIPTQGTTCTLKAFGVKEGYEDSNVSVFIYTIKQNAPENPSEEESASEPESSSAEESVPTEEGSTTEESEADKESPDFPEDEDPQDGVKWNYNEEKVIYKDLSMHGEIAAAIKPKTYDGTPYRPAVKVTATENGKKVTLTEGTDYRVLYFNNTHAGTATVTVRGNGIYKGTISRKFEIKKKPCKKLKVLTDSMPTGDTSAPKVYVYDGSVLLKENKDYILDGITPNLTATKGRKQIYIIAASYSDYEGTTTAKLTVYDADQSRIQGIINSPECVKLSQSTYPYTGKACKPTAVVTINGQTLTAGKDYAITYQNNKETGTAFAIITGKGAYAGSVVKEFTIKPSDGEFTLKKPIAAPTYNGRLQKPKLTVMANGKTLKPNKDYTLTYTNNLHATDRAKVTVRGRGNYTNIPTKTFYFTINPCHIKKASVKGIQGSLTITYAKHLLVEGVDYDIIYGDAAGKNKITVTIKAKEGSSFTGEVIKKCAVPSG